MSLSGVWSTIVRWGLVLVFGAGLPVVVPLPLFLKVLLLLLDICPSYGLEHILKLLGIPVGDVTVHR